MRYFITTILLLIYFFQSGIGQESMDGSIQVKEKPPRYNIFRAKENYAYLKDPTNSPYAKDFFDPIKFISLNKERTLYFTIGGEVRPRFEHFSNRKWKKERINYYSHRASFHSNIVLGKRLRVFAELYHGFTSLIKQGAQYDELNFHQLFAELPLVNQEDKKISLIFGRQELKFGTSRLVTLREGPNVRQDFDMARAAINLKDFDIQIFYGKEVRTRPAVFDNTFALFDNDALNAQLWGSYSQFKIKGLLGSNELYYLGFHTDQIALSDVIGPETRHTIGVRRYGKMRERLRYNTELIYQFGDADGNTINAFNIETDWGYMISKHGWKSVLGLKLVYASGDQNTGDNKLNSFNPLYVSPNIYNLASAIIPINIISLHPSIVIKPNKKLSIFLEYAFFWRASENDGIYSPPRSILRAANGSTAKDLGNQIGLKLDYTFNRHLKFNFDTSIFFAGAFQEATGEAETLLHIAPTLSYKF